MKLVELAEENIKLAFLRGRNTLMDFHKGIPNLFGIVEAANLVVLLEAKALNNISHAGVLS